MLLERIAGNLLENALHYNHTGGHVTVSSGTANGHAFVRVANTGPLVTPVHMLEYKVYVGVSAARCRSPPQLFSPAA